MDDGLDLTVKLSGVGLMLSAPGEGARLLIDDNFSKYLPKGKLTCDDEPVKDRYYTIPHRLRCESYLRSSTEARRMLIMLLSTLGYTG